MEVLFKSSEEINIERIVSMSDFWDKAKKVPHEAAGERQ